jgi:hypothetical protein
MMMLAIEPAGAVAVFCRRFVGKIPKVPAHCGIEPADRDAFLELRRHRDDRVAFRPARDTEMVPRELDLDAFARNIADRQSHRDALATAGINPCAREAAERAEHGAAEAGPGHRLRQTNTDVIT